MQSNRVSNPANTSVIHIFSWKNIGSSQRLQHTLKRVHSRSGREKRSWWTTETKCTDIIRTSPFMCYMLQIVRFLFVFYSLPMHVVMTTADVMSVVYKYAISSNKPPKLGCIFRSRGSNTFLGLFQHKVHMDMVYLPSCRQACIHNRTKINKMGMFRSKEVTEYHGKEGSWVKMVKGLLLHRESEGWVEVDRRWGCEIPYLVFGERALYWFTITSEGYWDIFDIFWTGRISWHVSWGGINF